MFIEIRPRYAVSSSARSGMDEFGEREKCAPELNVPLLAELRYFDQGRVAINISVLADLRSDCPCDKVFP